MDNDTAIMNEIETFLANYGFNKTNFIEFIMEEQADRDENYFDKANLYKYFNGRPVPLFTLLKIVGCLCRFEFELDQDDIRLEAYRESVDAIVEKAIRYVVENRNTTKGIRKEIRYVLGRMEDQDIKTLLECPYVFNIPVHVWNFWVCYCCLGYLGQEAVKTKLNAIQIPAEVYVQRLSMYHKIEMREILPLIEKATKYYEKYEEQSKAGENDQEKKKLIDNLAKLFEKYPYAYKDIVHHFEERTIQSKHLDKDDWYVVGVYTLACSILDREELEEIDQVMLKYLRDERYWRILTKVDWDNIDWESPPDIEHLPKKVVNYYMERFLEHRE